MKKGFTIIEILTAIAIIGVISTVIIFGYREISNRNHENLYKAKVKEIEVAALKYGEANIDEIKSNSSITILVKDLIEKGFIEGDNEDKTLLIDPRRDHEFINGYVLIYFDKSGLNVIYNDDLIKVKLTQDTSNLKFDEIKLKSSTEIPENLSLDYCVYELNNLEGYYANFTSGKLKGSACNNYTFKNIRYFIDVISEKPIIAHTATIKVYDNYGRETKQSITAKIKEIPNNDVLEIDAYYASGYPNVKTKYDNKWTNQNIIIVGVEKPNTEYQYSLDLESWHYLTNEGLTYTNEGINSIYVRKIEKGVIKDTLGMVTIKIDKTAPTCKHGGDSTSWTNQNRTITKGCNDQLSGCATNQESVTFSKTTQTETISAYTIKDNAGNSRSCPTRTANVYVDKSAPKCTYTGESTDWTNEDRTITKGCNDAHSGCLTPSINQTFTTTTQTAVLASYKIKDKAGNETICPAKTANIYVDKSKPTCSWSGVGDNWVYSREVKLTCGSSHSGCDPTLNSKAWNFTTTTETANLSYTIKNKAGTTEVCTYNNAPIYVDRTSPTCTHSGDSTMWTNMNRVITKGCKDSHSGCLTSSTTQTFTNTVKSTTIAGYTITDKVGNTTTCPARSANIYIDKITPTLSKITNSSNGNWTNSDVTLSAQYTDQDSGLLRIEYSYDKSKINTDITQPPRGLKTFTSSSTWTAERDANVYYRAVDVAGNRSAWSPATKVRIDKTAPKLVELANSSSGNWTKSNVTLSANYSDAGSGLQRIEYTYDKSKINTDVNQPTKGAASFTSKGTWTAERNSNVYYRAVDVAGNTSAWSTATRVRIDKTAPKLVKITNSSDGKWTKSNVSLSANYSDAGSGLQRIEYTYDKSKVNTDTTQPTKGAASFTSKGTWSAARNSNVYFRSVDAVGNTSAWSTATKVRIDKTAPSCSVSQSGSNMVLSYSDAASGVAGYGMSRSSTATYNSTKSMAGVHNARFYGYVKDHAGNTKSCSAVANIACDKLTTWNINTQYKAINKSTVSGQNGFKITSVSVVSSTSSSAKVRLNWRIDVYNKVSYILSRTRYLCLTKDQAKCDTSAVLIKNSTTQWGPGVSHVTGSVEITVTPGVIYKVKVYEGGCVSHTCNNYLKAHFTYETGNILRINC